MEMETKTGIGAAEIKRDQLYGVLTKASGEDAPYGDVEILEKVRAAENFYEHDLNILFGKHKIISMATERGITVNPDADPPEIEEPGYDYETGLFEGERWSFLQLRHRPVIPDRDTRSGITNVIFSFPSATSPVFTVPQSWIRPSFKFGELNLIPAEGAILASFTAFFLRTATGGVYGIPKTIFVDYFAGLEKERLKNDHADLLEGVRMRTFLLLAGILSNIRSEGLQSGSIGLDGLSHSRGFGKYGAYSGTIEHYMNQEKGIRRSWKDHNKGVVLTVV